MRKASPADLPAIMRMVRQTIAEMHSYNNFQWDEQYPQESDFANDITRGELYVAERNGQVAGFVCINRTEPLEYQGVSWTTDDAALVIHRMVVGSEYRRQKVGTELVEYAAVMARQMQMTYIKTDTYSLNLNAQKTFEYCGYRMVGTMRFRGREKPFFCYEKQLSC